MRSEMHGTGSPADADQREHVGQLIGAALRAADPEAAVRRHLSLLPNGVRVGKRVFPLAAKSNLMWSPSAKRRLPWRAPLVMCSARG